MSILVIIDRFRKGGFFEPVVVMSSAYLLILVVGSVLFELIKEKEYRFYLSNFIGVGYFALFAGLILSQNYHYTINLDQIKKYIFVTHSMKNRALVYFAVFICILATFALFIKGGVPMLAADVQQARLDLVSGNGFLNIFLYGLTVFPLAVLYDAIARGARGSMIVSHLLAGFVTVVILLTGGRSRTFAFLAEYLAMYFFFYRRSFSFKLMVACTVLLTLFLAVVGAYRRGGEMDVPTMTKEIGIILATRPVMFSLVVDKFNESRMFYGSRYFGDLVKLLPGHQTGANVDLKYEVWPNADKMPDSSGVTPSVIGEAYMNFGVPGIFWFMFFEGLFLGLSYRFMLKKPTFLRCAFYFMLIIDLGTAVSAGVGTRLTKFMLLWFWLAIIHFLYEWRLKLWEKTPDYGSSLAR